MTRPGDLIRSARRRAGLTQAELGSRLGTTQAAISRLERGSSNPTVATLTTVLRGAGQRLELTAVPQQIAIDEAQVRARVAMTPAERLADFAAGRRNMERLAAQASRVD